MTPYLASLDWYRGRVAGEVRPPKKGRWNRSRLAEGTLLTIPVDGGITAIKRADPLSWHADDTRQWRHQHLGTINALYGRTPYYQHFAPGILDAIADRRCPSIAEMARRIDAVVTGAIDIETLRRQWDSADDDTRRRLAEYADELGAVTADHDLAMAHYLFSLGPDAIFLLIPAL